MAEIKAEVLSLLMVAGALAYHVGRPIDDCEIDPLLEPAHKAWAQGWREARDADREGQSNTKN